MRKVKLWIDTGYVGANYEEVIEVEDDCSEEELEEIAKDYLYNYIYFGWYEVDE